MAHLELLIEKGEIPGPPYAMSNDQEFPFLHKFIERQAANIPHNPRLRGSPPGNERQPQLSVDIHCSGAPRGPRPSMLFIDDPSYTSGSSFTPYHRWSGPFTSIHVS